MDLIRDYWWIINGAIIPLGVFLLKQYTKIKTELNQSRLNDMVIMQDLILNLANKCFLRESRTQWETKHLLDMTQEYFKSGGNNFVHNLQDEFLELPIKNIDNKKGLS